MKDYNRIISMAVLGIVVLGLAYLKVNAKDIVIILSVLAGPTTAYVSLKGKGDGK